MENNQQSTNFGSIIGIILVVIVLIVGGIYFGQQRIQKSNEFKNTIQEELGTTSDEVIDLESEANSMNFDSLGDGIENL